MDACEPRPAPRELLWLQAVWLKMFYGSMSVFVCVFVMVVVLSLPFPLLSPSRLLCSNFSHWHFHIHLFILYFTAFICSARYSLVLSRSLFWYFVLTESKTRALPVNVTLSLQRCSRTYVCFVRQTNVVASMWICCSFARYKEVIW